MFKSTFKKSYIARRFILYIILFSSLITLISTGIQLFRDYNADLDLIQLEFKRIEDVHLASLSSALWEYNATLVETNIKGILQNRDIKYVEVSDGSNIWVKDGEIQDENNIQRRYIMTYLHKNKNVKIGSLLVSVSLDGVYQRLYDKVWIILISNAIKTLLVGLFISFLFVRLVGRHLEAIADFVEKHEPLSKIGTLALNRNTKKYDEFDAVVNSINAMHERLQQQVSVIEQQKQHLAQTLNSIGDAVITTDEKGLVTSLNPVAEKLTGWKNKDALMQPLETIFSIVDAETREPIESRVSKVISGGEITYLSNYTTLISKNGKEIQIADSAAPIRSGGEILGLVLVFNDVTEKYQMRESLALKEQEQREILQSMLDAVITIGENGKIHSFNTSAERLFGYMADEVVGKNVNLLMPSDFSNSHDGYIHNYLDGGDPKIIGKGREVVGLKKNKETFPISLSIAELPKQADGKRRFISSCFDLTQVKKQEEHLRRTQKMDALGQLTGGIAHDYNNMLGVILGYAELLEGRLDDPELKKYVKQILHAGQRGTKLTKKLLSFSRVKALDTKILDINKLLSDSKQVLEKTLTSRIQLKLSLEEQIWPVRLDEGELEDAILNISINAMHAMVGPGQLMLETRNERINELDGKLLDIKPGDYVRLTITDTGEGMDDDTKEKVFDPFYSTKGDKGSGLGLSQVYGFVKRCGGTIKVTSQLQQGTQFILYLPRNSTEESGQAKEEKKGNSDNRGNEVILVVDDEVALLNLTSEILTQQGYKVFAAENGRKALAIMKAEHVDLLITDIIMPNMDGYALAAVVQKKYPKIKIQLVSGFSDDTNRNKSEDKTLSESLLLKPFRMQDLLGKVNGLLKPDGEV